MFDEPFNGMDPEGIIWMRQFLRALAGEGRAVLVSSHLMSELQDTADQLVVVGRGKVIADASVADLLAMVSRGRITVRSVAAGPAAADAAAEAAAVLAQGGASVTSAGNGALTVTGLPAETVAALLNRHGVPFSELAGHRATLEDAYLELTRDAVDYRAATPGDAK
jgi:ABC-2 type transport system ATP-binding protein